MIVSFVLLLNSKAQVIQSVYKTAYDNMNTAISMLWIGPIDRHSRVLPVTWSREGRRRKKKHSS